jgi:hypothetical protein
MIEAAARRMKKARLRVGKFIDMVRGAFSRLTGESRKFSGRDAGGRFRIAGSGPGGLEVR